MKIIFWFVLKSHVDGRSQNWSLIVFSIIEARILSFLNDNAAGGTTEKEGRTARVIKGIKAVVR